MRRALFRRLFAVYALRETCFTHVYDDAREARRSVPRCRAMPRRCLMFDHAREIFRVARRSRVSSAQDMMLRECFIALRECADHAARAARAALHAAKKRRAVP